MASFGRVQAAAFLLALSPVACDLSTDAEDGGAVAVVEFRLVGAEPPGTLVDGSWSVAPRARLEFALAVDGPVRALVLSAGDRVLAELPPEATSFVDDCEVGPCGTAEAGEVLYTLAAVGSGDDPPVDARSLGVRVDEVSGEPEGT